MKVKNQPGKNYYTDTWSISYKFKTKQIKNNQIQFGCIG